MSEKLSDKLEANNWKLRYAYLRSCFYEKDYGDVLPGIRVTVKIDFDLIPDRYSVEKSIEVTLHPGKRPQFTFGRTNILFNQEDVLKYVETDEEELKDLAKLVRDAHSFLKE